MNTNLAGDFYIFLIAINSGLIAGVIYDLYRVFRYYSKPKKILSTIEDLLFWLLIAFIFFYILVKTTEGVFRGFVIIGFFLGSMLYLNIISKYNFPILIKIFKLILKLISEIIRVLVFPFKLILQFIRKKTGKIFILLNEFFKEMKKYRKIISNKK